MEVDGQGDVKMPEVVVKRDQPEEAEENEGPQTTKLKSFELPEGAEVIANKGKGNCMPQAIAQCLSQASGESCTHRQGTRPWSFGSGKWQVPSSASGTSPQPPKPKP